MGIKHWALLYSCISLMIIVDCFLNNVEGLRSHLEILIKFADGSIYSNKQKTIYPINAFPVSSPGSGYPRPNPWSLINLIGAFFPEARDSTRTNFSTYIPIRDYREPRLLIEAFHGVCLLAAPGLKINTMDLCDKNASNLFENSRALHQCNLFETRDACHDHTASQEDDWSDDDDDENDVIIFPTWHSVASAER